MSVSECVPNNLVGVFTLLLLTLEPDFILFKPETGTCAYDSNNLKPSSVIKSQMESYVYVFKTSTITGSLC